MIDDGFDDVEVKVLSDAVDEFQGVAVVPYIGGVINDLCSQFGDPGVVMAGKIVNEDGNSTSEFVFYWKTSAVFSPYNILKAYIESDGTIYLIGLHRDPNPHASSKWLGSIGGWTKVDFSDDEHIRGIVFDMLLWDGKKVEKK
jgi:hypothetical protein